MQPSDVRTWMPSELREWMLDNTAEGYQEGDEFVRYDMGNVILHFQFRNGRLINHNPADFSEPPVLHGTWQ